MEKTYKVLHLFCGIGGGSIGFANAQENYRGIQGKFENICGIDVDPEACEDYQNLTGNRAENLDLFSREQYIQFHGKQPPESWEEITPGKLRKIVGDIPDVIFTSPPCKGFSGLLPEASAKTQKYQALNKLTVRSIQLILEAYSDNLPALILLENVPRITTRGKHLLEQIKQQLELFGYAINDDRNNYHDCGEIGGLAQKRKRYLMIARNPAKLDAFVYKPPTLKLKSIGEVLGNLPLPGQGKYGKLHQLPNLQWKTWVRLALIPAGGDWRDLENCDWEKYIITQSPGPLSVKVSNPSTGFKSDTHHAIYRVQKWDDTGKTVTGAMRPNNGAPCIADPRLDHQKGRYTNKWQVLKWDGQATTVTGTQDIQAGAQSIEDPRLTCSPRAGTMGVQKWDEPSKTVIGAGDIHAGSAAVADPRIPEETQQGVFIIIAEDGTWHRPLTTLELGVLQSLPLTLYSGEPLKLAGNSDARFRERIGNMVPPAAAQAIADTMLRTLLANESGEWLMSGEEIWVTPYNENEYAEVQGEVDYDS
ncbi:DNA cytosine methyltransferase [Bacillus sp. FJAT-29937]|uniref:DNA cytosine methyltransferase n=1 Tax=Bacillus sp. FJAT-29937 TaxID=1720553 RepID=UPI00082BA449|nr:DNA cytosine methyltransferase [Bacillus sp. FJAT-29937]